MDLASLDIAATLIQGSPDGILAFDREFRYTLWNPAMERISGMRCADVVGRVAPELFPFLVETGEMAHFQAVLLGQARVSREQRFRVPATGSWGFFDGHYFPVHAGGDVVGGVGIIRNVTERKRNSVRASAQVRVSQILASSQAADAGALILAAIGEAAGWDCGAYWEVDEARARLRCDVTWRADPSQLGQYIESSRSTTFAPGEGLPGRVWQTLESSWIEDIAHHPLYSGSPLAARERLVSAIAFPVRVAGEAIGVMELFSRKPAQCDPELLALLEDLGTQFGQVVERKRVEGSFAESRAYFRAVFEHAPFTIQLFAPDGKCLDANPAFEKMWDVGREALAGYNLLTDPQLASLGLTPAILRAFAGEAVQLPAVKYDPARNTLPGRGRWTEASLYPIFKPNGAVSSVVLLHRDVTERVQLARAQSAARLGTWDWDLSTGRLQWSDGIYELLGVEPGAFAPSLDRWREFQHPDDMDRVAREHERILARGGAFDMEFRVRRADGEERWVASIGRVEGTDAGNQRLLGVNIDIHARKQAEIAQQRQVDEIRTLLDTLPVGVLIAHDPDCRRITGNRIGNRLMRTGADENISMTPGDDEARPAYRTFRDGLELPVSDLPLRRVLAGRPVQNLDFQLRFQDGSQVDLLASAATLHDEHGAVRGAVATLLDVTEANRARQALHEADRRKTEFLATLAHELRNPLAPIRNAVEILRMRGTAPELASVCGVIERQLRHMVRLVDDLLDVSRITRGRLELRRETLNLARLVMQAVEAARPMMEREAHVLDVEAVPESAWLDGDEVRLVQALVNLLANAAKYTPRGGRVRLRVVIEGAHAVVSVTDTGIGMDAGELANVFEMFWQAGAGERSHGGLGIGLSLARSIVEMHGGRLEARSPGHGQGSEFVMRLPLAAGAPAHDEPRGKPSPAPAAKRILVADDSADNAASLSELLRLHGHEVRVATDGREAIETGNAWEPDVVVLDVGMPTLDGRAACREIRLTRWGRDARIVALTGWGQPEDRESCLASGFDDHFVKPLDPAAIWRLVK